MAKPYYEPQSIAPILQQGFRDRSQYLAQPKGGLIAALPAVGQLVDASFQADALQKKKASLLEAQQGYANYLSKLDTGTATPQDHAIGRMYGLSLGIDQKPVEAPVDPRIMSAFATQAKIEGAPIAGTKKNEAALSKLSTLDTPEKIAAREAAKGKIEDAKVGKADEKFWASQYKLFAPTNAARGSLIGQAAYGNARADRALTTLADPNIKPQQIQAVVNDYAGIMQGGAPHADSMRSMGFDTLLTDFANLKTKIFSEPQNANQPEVVNTLRNMISEIKKVDNQIISNNLDTFEATNSEQVSRNPTKWQKIRNSVMRGTQAPNENKTNTLVESAYIKSLGLK